MGVNKRQLLEGLRRYEGLRLKPYLCSSGRVTIGYGWNLEADGSPIREYDADLARQCSGLCGRELLAVLGAAGYRWTADEAEARLERAADAVLACLEKNCPAYRRLLEKGEQARAAVLADMAFNMGWGTLKRFWRMFAALERQDYETAAREMLNSAWAGQVGRRAGELARVMRVGGTTGGAA